MKKNMKHFWFVIILLTALPVSGGEQSWVNSWWSDVTTTWKSNDYEVIAPVHIYHVRATYSREKIKSYNENPQPGLGIGKYRTDEWGNQHTLYAMVFQESFKDPQFMVGYMWQKIWRFGSENDWKVGAGYTAFLTARRKQSYIPIPLATPTLGVAYKRLWLRTAWMPWIGNNNGNVFLTMLSYQF